MGLELLWVNRRLIGELIGLIALVGVAWWFFWHNPKVIAGLESDKAELARILEAKNKQLNLYADIEKGRVTINESVHKQISSLRATARPRRTIIIRSGIMLPSLPATGTASH